MTAFCLGGMYQGRLRSGNVRPSIVETDRSAEMSEDLAESGRVSGGTVDACSQPSRRGAGAEADADTFERIRKAAGVLGVSGEALSSLLEGEDFLKKEEFFPALDSVMDIKMDQARKEAQRSRHEDRAEERAERERERRLQMQMMEMMLQRNHQERNPAAESFRVKLEPLEDKDDVDAYLEYFERVAIIHGWPRRIWALRILPLMKGQARDCVQGLSTEDAADYDAIKKALLFRFRRTAEFYRKKFRSVRREENETFVQASNRMVVQAKKWFTLKERDVNNPRDVWDLFMQEAFYHVLPAELEVKVRERQPRTLSEVAEAADVIVEAKASSRPVRTNVTPAGPRQEGNKIKSSPTKGSPGGGRKQDGCYKCGSLSHIQRFCPKSKVNSSVAITGAESDADLSLCGDSREREFSPISSAEVNGIATEALRDTGAGAVIVASRLVKDESWTGREQLVQMANADVSMKFRTAFVEVVSDHLTGKVEAIVMDNPSHGLIIGNRATLDDGSVVKIPVFASTTSPGLVVAAVTTRSQTGKGDPKPLIVSKPTLTGVDNVRLRQLQSEDESLSRARESAKREEWITSGKGKFRFAFRKSILYREYDGGRGIKRQVVVPRELRVEVMRVAHEAPMSGHLANQRTRERLWADFYWPGMSAEIRRFCQSCDRCQRMCPRSRVKKAPLEKLPLVGIPFHRVAVDLVGPIVPASQEGHRYILVMVDYATRYPEATPLKSIDTVTVAEALLEMWTRVGIPHQVLSDRGTQFVSEIMQEVHRLLSVKGLRTTPYHAQCNGLVERFNGTLKSMLKKLCDEKPNSWNRYIAPSLFAYREVPQESTGFSPFELLYGRTVRGPMAILRELWTREEREQEEVQLASNYVIELKNRIEETCKLVQRNLRQSGDRYKKHFDKKARVRTFKAGDQVLLLLPTKHNKLEMSWRGPFRVEERQGPCDYWIKMGEKRKLYHVNMLKGYLVREPAVEETVVALSAAAVIEEADEWEEASNCVQEIPLIPLKAEETVDDIKLDPRCPEIHESLRRTAKEFPEVLTDLPRRTELGECNILLDPDAPVRTKQYPLPFSERGVIGKEVKEMLALGVIEKSTSPFCSPILLVKKKDGKVRFCQDLRQLNKRVIFDAEPMPDVEQLFAKLGKAKYLSKIDLTKGYWQIPMKEEDKAKTAFSTPQGHFQWTVMPFGLKTAGAIFSRMMRDLLRPLDMPEVENFMDDILIATETQERHVECVRGVFSRLREVSLAAKPSKCFLGFKDLDYLGYRVGQGVIKPDEEKMEKIRHAPQPATKKQIRSFLGLVGFYRRFVPNFSEIAVPLTEATKDRAPVKVAWTDDCDRAFNTLKEKLCEQPVCALPDFSRTFILRTDASDTGLGAILIQDQGFGDQTIGCASRKLNDAEKNYSTIEKELLAVVWGIQKFSPYLYGREFVLQSDHLPLQHLDQMKNANSRLMRWAMQLQPYAFVFKSIPGKENVGADFLSRL